MHSEFTSSIPFRPARIPAVAIYCSDGRFGEHIDDFLIRGLGLPDCDRIALPGGPACLADRHETKLDDHGVVDNVRFLIEAHGLDRVILIAHHDCGFYALRLGVAAEEMGALQRADLQRAAAYVRAHTGVSRVEAFFARILNKEGDRDGIDGGGDAKVRFEAVSTE